MIVIKVNIIILLHCLGFICADKDYDYNRPSNHVDYNNGNEFVNVNKLSELENTGYDYGAPKQLEVQYHQIAHYSQTEDAIDDPKSGDIKPNSEPNIGSYDYSVPKQLKVQYDQTAHYSPTKDNNNYAFNDHKSGDIKSHSESNDGYSVRGSYDYSAPKQLKVQYDQTAHHSLTKDNNNYATNDHKSGDIKSHSESNDGYSVRGSYDYSAPKQLKVQYDQTAHYSPTKDNNNYATNDHKSGDIKPQSESNHDYSVHGSYDYPAPKQLKVQYDQTAHYSPTTDNNNYAINDHKFGDIKPQSESNHGYSVHGSYDYPAPKQLKVQYDQTAHHSLTKDNNNYATNDHKSGDIKSLSESNDGYSVRGSYDYSAPKQLKVQYDQTAHYSPTKDNNNYATNDHKSGDIKPQSESNHDYSVHGSYDYPAPKQLKVQYDQTAHYSPTKYNYNYAVNDLKTGDIKSHSETNDGYSVHGSYSLVDPDGFKRIVTYTADDLHGFNAIVNRVPYVLQTTSKPVSIVESRGPVTFVLNLKDRNGKHFVEEASSQRLSQTAEILESTTPQVQSLDSYAAPAPLENEINGAPYA